MTTADQPGAGMTCPTCGAAVATGASFCEACGRDLTAGRGATSPPRPASDAGATPGMLPGAVATPVTAPAGQESPLDVGWTGAVAAPGEATTAPPACVVCGTGRILDGYCDHCGSPAPDPRDHSVEATSSWVGGACDIGIRHTRNDDAMALASTPDPGGRATLVVCDGVTTAVDSNLASLAAARASLEVLDQPLPRGAGTPAAFEVGARRVMADAVAAAQEAVAEITANAPRQEPDATVADNPPSCTFAAAVVDGSRVVAANIGDSRVYWLPDSPDEEAVQLGRDDSWAEEQMAQGVPRLEAENGPHAHAITRWLGTDSPQDEQPHVSILDTADSGGGWLLVCSDGLWNYWSPADELHTLLSETIAAHGGDDPSAVAAALVEAANAQGGRDNITVALARLAGRGSLESPSSTPHTELRSPQQNQAPGPDTTMPRATVAGEEDPTHG